MKIFFGFLLIYSFSMCSYSQTKQIESLFSEYQIRICPGASVLISINNQIVFNKGFGYANLEDKIKVGPETNFRLASVTKQFTAAAVLLLVQRGLLNLDTKLTDIFHDFPEYGKKIAVKNLLNHTSGVIDYEDLIPDTVTVQVKDLDVFKMMCEIDSTYFKPGSQYRYSNTGFALLAMAVEKISGKSFSKFLSENIFSPLGMKSTSAHEEGISEVSNRAYGYERIDSSWVSKDQSITSAVLGDGGIYSNVKDLLNWEQSLYTNKILSEDLLEEAMSQTSLNNGEKIDYGYGWHLKEFNSEKVVYHTGSTQGFRNVIYRVPSKEFCVIILTNRNEGEPEKIADEIFTTYFTQ